MYSVTPAVALLWRRLLETVALRSGVPLDVLDHAPPAPIAELWARRDLGAVLMCGLPYSMATEPPALVAAPVPAPSHYRNAPQYWSEFVVRADSAFHRLEDTFGGRIAFTAPHSQSGYAAALCHLIPAGGARPLYCEIIAPCVTPRGALSAVADDRAEVAPVDAFAFDLLRRHAPALAAQFRVVARTEPTPIPPFVASQLPSPLLVRAFVEAHADPTLRAIMDELLLERFVSPSRAAYAPRRQIRQDLARRKGFIEAERDIGRPADIDGADQAPRGPLPEEQQDDAGQNRQETGEPTPRPRNAAARRKGWNRLNLAGRGARDHRPYRAPGAASGAISA
jgi:ABC-type phosphate/phosphonate transport system substrate-binding protein